MTGQPSRWLKGLPGAGFLVALSIHACWRLAHAGRGSAWADMDYPRPLPQYLTNGDVLLGLSYGAVTALVIHGIWKMALNRRAGMAGAVCGLSLGGLLALAGCFLVGCCGSPMLAIWGSLFGAKALGAGKLATAGLTLGSVGLGWWWLRRCCRLECCQRGK